MPYYTFRIKDDYKTVDAFDLEEALKVAGIDDNDYELVETDDFENKCFMSAITDDILFGE